MLTYADVSCGMLVLRDVQACLHATPLLKFSGACLAATAATAGVFAHLSARLFNDTQRLL